MVKAKISLGGIHVLFLRWRKKNFIRDMFRWLEVKYGGFKRTH